jgi:hypothetical protein
MKRSKALKLIANQLDFLAGTFNGYKDSFKESELKNADVILTTLEHAGMLPPTVRLPAFGVNDNAWEPEDE